MNDQSEFTARLQRINAKTKREDKKLRGFLRSNRRSPRGRRSGGSLLVMPLMTLSIIAGGTVFAWEVMDRPTDTPLGFATYLAADLSASDLIR